MRSIWKGIGGAALVAAVLVGTGGSAHPQVAWQELTLEKALALAKKNDQLILVDVWAGHCGQCAVMDREIWNTVDGALIAQDMIPLKIDSDSPSGREFKRTYPVTGLPALIVIDSGGREVDRVTGYWGRTEFLNDAAMLRSGVDPIPDLEASLAQRPNDPALMLELFEKYLNRAREREADALLARILAADPKNAGRHSEKALGEIGRYYASFRHDLAKSDGYWRQMVEQFPASSAIGAAVKATYDRARETGTVQAWTDWICGITKANPDGGLLAYSVASLANRGGLRGKCFADAARTAFRLKAGPAYMDSLANVLEGR